MSIFSKMSRGMAGGLMGARALGGVGAVMGGGLALGRMKRAPLAPPAPVAGIAPLAPPPVAPPGMPPGMPPAPAMGISAAGGPDLQAMFMKMRQGQPRMKGRGY